jgi:hypothetical protein
MKKGQTLEQHQNEIKSSQVEKQQVAEEPAQGKYVVKGKSNYA